MSGGSFLERMARASRERVRAAEAIESYSALAARALQRPPPPVLHLDRFDIIAELKLRSPAAGGLATADFDRNAQLSAYARGGAAAVSILTEPTEFNGALTHIQEAAEILTPLRCPILRKDFLTEPYQIIEARAAGASGVLLIVTMLSDAQLEALLDCAHEFGLFVLLEAFDRDDLKRLQRWLPGPAEQPVLAGVNCRDLKTLAVDFERFGELAPHLPRRAPVVAESGIGRVEDVEAVASLGYRVALVGSALMQAAQPGEMLARYVAAGRAAVAGA